MTPGSPTCSLALEYARCRAPARIASGGSVRFCDLTEARDEDAAAGLVAEAVGVSLASERADGDARRLIGEALRRESPVLLVLDNLEQIIEHAAAIIDAWMMEVPGLTVIATSREPLDLALEERIEVPPLEVPSAVALFHDRASRVTPSGATDDALREDVDRLVRRLRR